MKLFEREPRSVYRIYAEDDYFDDERPPSELGEPELATQQASSRAPRSRSLVVAALIAAVASVLAICLLAVGHGSRRALAPTSAAPALERPEASEARPARPSARRPWRQSAPAHDAARRPVRPARPGRSREPIPAPVMVVTAPTPEPEPEFGFER